MPGGFESKRDSNPGGLECLLFFATVTSGFALTFDAAIARNVFCQIRALGDSTAPGVMTQSEVEEVPDSSGDLSTYRPKLQYKYSVAGKEYVGDRYRYGRWASSVDWAKRVVASHPVGSQVEIHYAPADPSDATLLIGLDGWTFSSPCSCSRSISSRSRAAFP